MLPLLLLLAAVLIAAFYLLSRSIVMSESHRLQAEFALGEVHYCATLDATGLDYFAHIVRHLETRRRAGTMTWLQWVTSLEDSYTTLAVSGGSDGDCAAPVRHLSMYYPGMLTALWSSSGSAEERLDLNDARQALAGICRRIDARLGALAEWDALAIDDQDVLCSSLCQRQQLYGLVSVMGGRLLVAAFRTGLLVLKKTRFLSKWKFGEFVSLDKVMDGPYSRPYSSPLKVNFAAPAIQQILLQIPHSRGRSVSAPQIRIENEFTTGSGRKLHRSYSVDEDSASVAEWAKLTDSSLEDTCDDDQTDDMESSELMIRLNSRTDLRRDNRIALFSR